MKVAWIGMGRIGKHMARRVMGAGHDLTGHARTPEKHRDIEAAGARITASIRDAVAGAGVVCVNVYDEAQLREALFADGALAAMAPGAILVIHSTMGPAVIRELAQARGDIRVLDAPFSGIDRNAAEGTITLMVGGDAACLEEARPVLAAYANSITHVGPLGAGCLLKLVNNALFGAQLLLAHDAMRIVTEGGIDAETAVATIGRSSGNSFAVQLFGSGAGADQVLAAAWPYIQKDVTIARDIAARMGLDLGLLEVATQKFIERD